MKKNTAIINSEGIYTDLDLLPDLMNVPAPRLSQHMISTFETFRSQMDLHSNCSRNDLNEELQIDNAAKESLPNIDAEVAGGENLNEDAVDGNKYSTSSQCIATITTGAKLTETAEDNLKKTRSSNFLYLGRKSSKDFGIVGTSSSISTVAKHENIFTPSSGRIGDIWNLENKLPESECGSSIALSKELLIVGDTDTQEEFIKKPELEEVYREYNPFETPKKTKSPLISKDDYYYRSSSSEESDIEVLIKIPKMAFVDKVFDQLSSACPNCRVIAVDVPEKHGRSNIESEKKSKDNVNKITEAPKPFTNIYGENPFENNLLKDFLPNSQEFIVANSEKKRKRKKQPSSNFPKLHNKFDPSRKLLRRSKSSITDPLKRNDEIWKALKNRQEQEDSETAIESTQTETLVRPYTSLTNPCWTISLNSELIEVKRSTQSAANDPIILESDATEAHSIETQTQPSVNNMREGKIINLKSAATSPNPSISFETNVVETSTTEAELQKCNISHDDSTKVIPVESSCTVRSPSKASESEIEVITEVILPNASLSTPTKVPRGALSVVNSWRNFTPTSENSHKTLNTGYCEIILDKPQEEILSNYKREKGMKMFEAQLFRNFDNKHCSTKTRTLGKRRNRVTGKYVDAREAFYKNLKRDKNRRSNGAAGEREDSYSSSSCFSLPDEPDIDVYNFSASVKEGEFPFVVEDPSNDCHSKYYSSGDEIQRNESCDRLKNDESENVLPGKTTTSMNSSKISMYSVGASLPPKPRAIRSTRSMNSNSSMSPRAQKGRLAIQGKGEKLLHRVSSSTISVRSLPSGSSSSSYAPASDINSNVPKMHTSDSMITLDISKRKPELRNTVVNGNDNLSQETMANKEMNGDISNKGKQSNYHLCLKSRQRFRQWYMLTVNWCSRRNRAIKKWLKFLHMRRKKATTSE